MTTVQLSFLPDNDQAETTVKRTSEPLVKYENGHYLWKRIGADGYEMAPELEVILLASQQQRRAA